MTTLHVTVILTILVSLAESAERGTPCTTPNDEKAVCTPITKCDVLKNAANSGDAATVKFAIDSQCGYDIEPLVCCGTLSKAKDPAYFSLFTKAPPTQKSTRRKAVGLDEVSGITLPDRKKCGLERETFRLIGAEVTNIDEFPWMALIHYRFDNGQSAGFKCGGTLINNRFVLTAAHCLFTDPEPYHADSVRLGEWQISSEMDCERTVAVDDCADPVVDIAIKEEISHPYFSKRNGNNDIALLRLAKDIPYTEFIRPICLPPPDIPPPPEGSLMTVCGWGATENGSQSDLKRKIEVPLVSNEICAKGVSSYTKFSPNQVCAGGIQGKDACQGDSGGPLMRTYQDDTSQWYQEGVVSRGRQCGLKNFAGIYTRVSRYVNWIINNIADYEEEGVR